MKCSITSKIKNKCWIWKAYCRNTRQPLVGANVSIAQRLVDWECGRRDTDTFERLFERLIVWNARYYFVDGYQSYAELIPTELLIQSKSETHLIESNNMPQRHWFARFRRKACVVSRCPLMVDLTVMLYAKFHVNGKFDYGSLAI